ncbi:MULTISPECIES: ribosome rescue protein RqcH [Methanobacterium]|uniref:Archaeal Rqc2 homolog aRqcH n=1 Tax=Methanobacterium veterum TaxID=408577 RepID=A0A9E5A6U8_9EURY|nr:MULTISPECIES: ribosome rescue protein RqcH [Methanobacterium]MCZ3364938.1 ribosome rescue protein RqcH [Methanobacterium veterum]MCZ3372693.1 ribosome rescue protein RqcH [Methanobacterium veterum]
MKNMSNVDVYAVCHELRDLLKGARVDKAYQPTKDTVLIRFHVAGKGRVDIVFQAGRRIHMTQYPLPNPKIPPNFPMLLRKYIKGATVEDIRQYNFDRIVELHVAKEKKFTLVIELFAKGNIILLDEEGKIILPLKRKLWSDRKISSKEEYKYPPKRGINPLEVKKEELEAVFRNSDSDVIRTLARSGLGGIYSEEILLRSNVQKDLPAAEISNSDLDSIYNSIYGLFEPLRTSNFHPQIVSDGKEDVLPLDLKIYENYKKEAFETYNDAADEFFSSEVRETIKNEYEDVWGAEVKKFEKRLKIQEETLDKFHKTIKVSKKRGDLLYANYGKIQSILDIIKDAREKYSWNEIASKLKTARKQGLAGADIIESLDKLGNLTLKIEDEVINIDAKVEIPENAEVYYEKAKKAKRKITGVNIAIEKTKKEIEKAKNKKEIEMERVTLPQKRVKKELKWFEKLRWFLSSDGFLVIGGRDANSNEIVVKKYMENNDVYFHSDIHGAPSVIIKSQGKEIPETTLNEAASFAASFSSAWTKGFGSQDVYWVHPDQVSKTPQSGEFVKKGAFIIRGTRNYVRAATLLIAVGVVDYEGERLMAGPLDAVKKYTDNYVIIKPGYTKKEALSREIRHKLDQEHIVTMDDLVRVLPSGKADIVDERDLRRR